MHVTDLTTPTLAELRPGRPSRPVLPGLEAALLAGGPPPADPALSEIPFAMATLSAYAYAETDAIASMTSRLGLAGARIRKYQESIDVLFVRSTAYLIQSEDGRIAILVYRGTSPLDGINWLTDLDIDPQQIELPLGDRSGMFHVHRGFYRNVRATGYEVVRGLRRALDGLPVDDDAGSPLAHGLEKLYIAGHSLGGAMAMLAALLLLSDEEYRPITSRLAGVYPLGAPMVCDPPLAELAGEPGILGDLVVRHVYGDDAVPKLPPAPTGDFAHFGRELRYDRGDGEWSVPARSTRPLKTLIPLIGLVPSFVARQLTALRDIPFSASLADHLPHNYVEALRPPGVRSEFGD